MALVRLAHKAPTVSIAKASRGVMEAESDRLAGSWPGGNSRPKGSGRLLQVLVCLFLQTEKATAMAQMNSIRQLFFGKGLGCDEIARATGFDAEAVGKYIYVEDFDQPLRN